MADISVNQYVRFYEEERWEEWVLDNSAEQQVYVGSPMILDISEDTVYPRIFDSSVTLASGDDVFVGFALEKIKVETTDTETDNEIKIAAPPVIVGLPAGSLTDADCGEEVYMSDSGTFTTTAGSNLHVGYVHRVVDGTVFIHFTRFLVQDHI